MTKAYFTITAVLALLSTTGSSAVAQNTLGWDKTFPKSTRVDHRKVETRDLQRFASTWELRGSSSSDRWRARCNGS
jgi:hypothetical protein